MDETISNPKEVEYLLTKWRCHIDIIYSNVKLMENTKTTTTIDEMVELYMNYCQNGKTERRLNMSLQEQRNLLRKEACQYIQEFRKKK